MMLLYLSHFTERDRFANEDDKYAWKGYDFNVLNKLDEEDYIRQGSYRSKSVYITKEGEARAKELLEKYGIAEWQVAGSINGDKRYILNQLSKVFISLTGKTEKIIKEEDFMNLYYDKKHLLKG